MSTATSRAVGTSITERLVGALTATWAAIQDRHADVPDVVLTLGSGTIGARRGEVTWGHFAAGRWHLTTAGEHAVTEPAADDVDQDDDEHQDDQQDDEEHGGGAGPGAQGLAELFVSGEGLRRGARAVLGTLLHEAAHGVASTRGIKDTSRQGRYHNRKFAELAAELGIVVAPDGARGWSATTLPDATAAVYVVELAGLAEAITAYRSAEATGPGTTTSRNNPPATCGCEPARRIRVARSVLAAGPIVCGVCEAEFTVDEPDDADGDAGGEADVDAYGEEVA